MPRFAPETVVEATTTTTTKTKKPPVYVDKNNNYNVAASNDEKQERRPKQAVQTKSSQEETQSDKLASYKHELDEHFRKMEALKSSTTTTTTTKPPVNIEKKQERKSRDRSKQPHERNSLEAQLTDYKDQLKKRDEYIRNLEKLESENNIQLQFFKDEVK